MARHGSRRQGSFRFAATVDEADESQSFTGLLLFCWQAVRRRAARVWSATYPWCHQMRSRVTIRQMIPPTNRKLPTIAAAFGSRLFGSLPLTAAHTITSPRTRQANASTCWSFSDLPVFSMVTCPLTGIVAVPHVVPRQTLGHQLPVHVLALDLDANQHAAPLVPAIVVHRHRLAHCQRGQPVTGHGAKRLPTLGRVDS
jgi:hypothetical protein